METLRSHDHTRQFLIRHYAFHEPPQLQSFRILALPRSCAVKSYNRNPCVWQVCTIPSRLSAPTLCFIRYK